MGYDVDSFEQSNTSQGCQGPTSRGEIPHKRIPSATSLGEIADGCVLTRIDWMYCSSQRSAFYELVRPIEYNGEIPQVCKFIGVSQRWRGAIGYFNILSGMQYAFYLGETRGEACEGDGRATER
jgi:hypothetical protein